MAVSTPEHWPQLAVDCQPGAVAAVTTAAQQLLLACRYHPNWALAQLLLAPPLSAAALRRWRAGLLCALLSEAYGWPLHLRRALCCAALSHHWHGGRANATELAASGIRQPLWQGALLEVRHWQQAAASNSLQGRAYPLGELLGLALLWATALEDDLPERALARLWRKLHPSISFNLWQAAGQLLCRCGPGLWVSVDGESALVIKGGSQPTLLFISGDYKGRNVQLAASAISQHERAPPALHAALLQRIGDERPPSTPPRRLAMPQGWHALDLALRNELSLRQIASRLAPLAQLHPYVQAEAQASARLALDHKRELAVELASLGYERSKVLLYQAVLIDRLSQWPTAGLAAARQLVWQYCRIYALLAAELASEQPGYDVALAPVYAGALLLHPRLPLLKEPMPTPASHPAQLIGLDDNARLQRISRYLAQRWQLASSSRQILQQAYQPHASAKPAIRHQAALLQLACRLQQQLQADPELSQGLTLGAFSRLPAERLTLLAGRLQRLARANPL